jgi:hypothetical protein
MPVLVEAHSVIIRCDALHGTYPGGWERFVADAPNRTLCSDGELARVGFMAPADSGAFIRHLVRCGLRHCGDDTAPDIAEAFQLSGLRVPCDWLEFGRMAMNGCGASVGFCRLQGGSSRHLATPAPWKYEGSLSQTFGFFPSDEVNVGLTFLRHENGMDVYYDSLAGSEVFVGRTGE